MRTLGVVFTGKEQLEVRQVEVPDPAAGQVLVEVSKTLISTGTETIAYQRRFAPGTHWDRWVQYPFPPGYSACGRVLKIGEGVTHVKPGDRVAGGGFHARHAVVPSFLCFPVPDGVGDEDATWATLAYITQHGFRKVSLALGETVVVIGLGLLGQLVAQYARVAGAAEVIAIDTAPRRLEMAAARGATHTISAPVAEAVGDIERLTGGDLAEVVFDMTGNAAVFASALRLLRRRGRLGLIGDTGTPADQSLGPEVITRELQIFGTHAPRSPDITTEFTPWSKAAMVRLFFRYLLQGRMRVNDLITHRFRPEAAAEAYNLLCTQRERAMGVIFDFDGVS